MDRTELEWIEFERTRLTQAGKACSGQDWTTLEFTELDWTKMEWNGLGSTELVWTGLY